MDTSNILRNSSIINYDSLIDLSAKLYDLKDETKILNASLLSLMGKLKFSRGAVYLKINDNFTLTINKGFKDLPNSIKILNYDVAYIKKEFKLTDYEYIFLNASNSLLIFFFVLANPLNPKVLSEDEIKYAELVTQITSNAIQTSKYFARLKEERTRAEKHNQLLSTLFEISRDFSYLLSKDKILKMLSYHLMGQLMINRFAVLEINSKNEYEIILNKFNEKLVNVSIENRLIKYIANVQKKDEVPRKLLDYFPYAELFVPMIVSGETKGLLVIGQSHIGRDFDENNKLFLSALANTAITALENERLIQEEIKKKALENELNLALEIQKNLLPRAIPKLEKYYIFGKTIPTHTVGGDYYDYYLLENNKLLVAIADVSGKGLPAALLMANFQSALRVLSTDEIDLQVMVKRLNNLVYSNTSPDKFITFFVGILDLKNHTFKYINAGHNYPFFYKAKEDRIYKLNKGGLLLGCLNDDIDYEIGEVNFDYRDTLVLYTDGVTEALNALRDEFSEVKLENILKDFYRYDAELLVEKIISEVNTHSFKSELNDDITVVVLKRNE